MSRVSFGITDRARPFLANNIAVRTRRLQVGGSREHSPDLAYERMRQWWRVADTIVQRPTARCAFPVQQRDGRLLAHAPCQIPISWAGARRLEVHFGVYEGAWNPGQTNGVRFEVRGLVQSEWTILAFKELRPREHEADRPGEKFVLDLPEGVDELLLVTDPLGDSSWDWSYWGPIWTGNRD